MDVSSTCRFQKPNPLAERVPTYRDLDLATEIPEAALDSPVHLDPEFAEYPFCERYSYGDPHGVKPVRFRNSLLVISSSSTRRFR